MKEEHEKRLFRAKERLSQSPSETMAIKAAAESLIVVAEILDEMRETLKTLALVSMSRPPDGR